MRCPSPEVVLAPYLDGELAEAERLSVEAHLAECAACATLVERQRHFSSLVKAAARAHTPPAPATLKARLRQGMQREHGRRTRNRAMRATAVAAGVALFAGLAHHQYRAFQRRLWVDDVATRHARQFPLEIERPAPEQLEAWFGGKLDHRVAVPHFPNAVAEGARLLNVREKQAAYIRYQTDRMRRHVGLFVYGDSSNDDDVEPAEFARAESHGYNVIGWRDGDVVYRLVTDLDDRDLEELLGRARAQTAGSAAAQQGQRLPTLEVQPASLQR